MLAACKAKSSGDSCSAEGTAGSCTSPSPDLPLACVPEGGGPGGPGGGGGPPDGANSGQSNTGTPIASTQNYTLGAFCNYSVDAINTQLQLPSKATWSCTRGQRLLTANGIPMHHTGKFPNPGNPNRISPQSVSYTVTTSPIALSGPGGRVKEPVMGLNGVKFDPGTGGSCPGNIDDPADCPLGPGEGGGPWRIEALSQEIFDFGADENNAHVQPSGHYHYHGVPNGMLSEAAMAGEVMQMIGWARDGFPVYARYGYRGDTMMRSELRQMMPSYRLKSRPDPDRPSVRVMPMGTFQQDWEYVEGLGDLDECNGRFGPTPEFPEGIYHYYATDQYPFVQRCVKGSIESAPSVQERGPGQGSGRGRGGGGRGRGGGDRPPRGGGRQ